MSRFSLIALLVVLFGCTASTSSPSADPAFDGDGKADSLSSELRSRSGELSVWLQRGATFETREGRSVLVVRGRASRNLEGVFSFVPDDAFGTGHVVSARKFEIWLETGSELNSILSGLPLFVRVNAIGGVMVQSRFDLAVVLSGFSGSSRVFLDATAAPIYDNGLRYQTAVRVPATTTRVVATSGGAALSKLADGRFAAEWEYDALVAVLKSGRASKLTVNVTPGNYTKSAALSVSVTDLQTTLGDPYEVWPSPVCSAEAQTCVDATPLEITNLSACGTYRLVNRCDLSRSPTTGDCHAAIRNRIWECVNNVENDPDFDSSTSLRTDIIEQCSDAEVVAPTFDALCALASGRPEFCARDIESFSGNELVSCRKELVNEELDGTCVFGSRYHDFERFPGALTVVSRRVLTGATVLTTLEQSQLVEAIKASAHDDVTTAPQVFDRVDGGEVNQIQFWDVSGRRAFTAYEFGAGDNSFGMFFNAATTTRAAVNTDGDLGECTAFWGPERRACDADADCAVGRCVGARENGGPGACIASDPYVGDGNECVGQDGCGIGSGLVCTNATRSSDASGLCRPAWMRDRFVSRPELAIPDNRTAGIEAQLGVSGLATVDTDVVVSVLISHPRISTLKVSLINPAGTEVVLFNGEREGTELSLRESAVNGFSGDESVNGTWRLKVVDRRRGGVGVINQFDLEITSRWD